MPVIALLDFMYALNVMFYGLKFFYLINFSHFYDSSFSFIQYEISAVFPFLVF